MPKIDRPFVPQQPGAGTDNYIDGGPTRAGLEELRSKVNAAPATWATVAEAEAVSYTEPESVVVTETGRTYTYSASSGATRDGIRVLTPAGGGRLLATKTGSDDVEVPKIGTHDHQSLTQSLQVGLSAGACNGNFVTDAGGGTINIASGEGMIRATNSSDSEIFAFRWAAVNGVAIPLNSVRYVGVEYNSGNPQAIVRTTNNWNGQTEFQAATVVNEGGTLHILNNPQESCDGIQKIFHRLIETQPFQFAERIGGGRFSGVGTRNLSLSPCEFYDGLNEFAITIKNTSTGDTFDSYYGSFTKVASQTQWDNQNYDNAGTLTALSANRYGVHWLYIEMDDSFALVYGKGNYNTISDAEAALPPASLPLRLSLGSRLAAKLIFQKGASSEIRIESAFDVNFKSGMPVSHGDLSDINGNGDYHLSESERDAATRTATASQSGLMSAAQAQSVANSAVAGSTGQIQYNNGGVLGTDADLFWNTVNKILTLNRLLLTGGNAGTSNSKNQILLSFNGTSNYQHAIKSRHNSASTSGNTLEFYLWNFGVDAAATVGTKPSLMLSASGGVSVGGYAGLSGVEAPSNCLIVSGNVGAGNSSPTARLHSKGSTSDSTGVVFIAEDSGNNEKLSIRCDGQLKTSGSRIIDFQMLTTDTTLTQSSKSLSVFNPSGTGMVITMHLSPPDGIVQTTVNASAFAVTLGRNSQKMAGLEANYTLPASTSITWQFFGATIGWLIISNG